MSLERVMRALRLTYAECKSPWRRNKDRRTKAATKREMRRAERRMSRQRIEEQHRWRVEHGDNES